MSAVKRVKSLLACVEKRAAQAELSSSRPVRGSGLGDSVHKTEVVSKVASKSTCARKENVIVKATGKAVEKALLVALFLQGMSDVNVRVCTGTTSAVDDIIVMENQLDDDAGQAKRAPAADSSATERNIDTSSSAACAVDDAQHGGRQEAKNPCLDDELTASRIRMVSMVEVAVSLAH